MVRHRVGLMKFLPVISTLALIGVACITPAASPTAAPAQPVPTKPAGSAASAPPAAPAAPASPAAGAAPSPAAAAPSPVAAAPAPAAAAPATKVAEVKVGLVYPTTGAVATTGQAMVNGHILAADEINAAGGIKALGGAKLINVIGDTQGKPEIALSQVRRLTEQENVPIIMGAFQSAVTFATTQLAEQKQVPHLVPIGAADNITERGFKYTFKISPKGSKAAEDMLNFVRDIGKKTGKPAQSVGLVYVDNLFGKNQADSLKKLMPKYGFNIVADLSYPETTADLAGVVAKLKAANPDVVLQSSYTQDGILLSRAMADQNYAPALGWIGFGGNAGDPQFFETVGKQANGYFTEGFWLPTLPVPGVKETSAAFKQRFNAEMDEYSAPAYTATYILADALERAGAADPQRIRDALANASMKVGAKGNLFSFAITFPPDGQTPSNFIFAQNTEISRVVVWPEEAAGSNKPTWPAVLGTKK